MNYRNSLAQRLYARLVRLYPGAFRDEFGGEMQQVFSEQYDAARQLGWLAVAGLCLRTLVDWASSLLREHVEASKGNRTMGVLSYFHRRLTFGRIFLGTAATLLVLCIVVTLFLLPKVYLSIARVSIQQQAATFDPYQIQTAFERIKSKKVLLPVIDELQLTAVFPKELGIPGEFSPEEAYRLLLPMLELRQSRNTSLVEIRVYAENPELGAKIANKIGEMARRAEGGQIVDSAVSPVRPVRPNVPLNLVIGASASVIFAVVVAAFARLALWIIFRRTERV